MVKEALTETAQELASGMSRDNPFMAFMLVVVVVMLGWFIWSNHSMQQTLVEIKLSDLAANVDKQRNIDKMDKRMEMLETEFRNTDDEFRLRLKDLGAQDANRFEIGKSLMTTVSNQLEKIIDNQQRGCGNRSD